MSDVNFVAGTVLPEKILAAITQNQLTAYAAASGDPNPIHLDETVAKSMGLPGVIAHGMLIAGFLAERAQELGEADSGMRGQLVSFQVRFKAMTLLGDILTLQSTVKAADAEQAALDVQALNQRGEVVATAAAKLKR